MGSTFIVKTRRALRDRAPSVADGHSMSPAAVLLPLYRVNGDMCVVLQKRSDTVEHHKGEISFPGGMVDAADSSLLETALREADEEMGIDPADVDVLGRLDDTPTISGFMISTYVGVLPSPYEFTPSEREVAEVVTAPLSALYDANARRSEARLKEGAVHTMPVFAHDGHVIFGATARILDQFLSLTG